MIVAPCYTQFTNITLLRRIHIQHASPMPFPCHAVIHTCHAAPLPCPDSSVSSVKARVVAETSELLVQQFNKSSFVECCYHSLQSWVWIVVRTGMLLIIFVEIRVIARSRARAGSPQVVSRRPCCGVALRTAWSEHGMGAAWQA
jgi:hypothetical protein